MGALEGAVVLGQSTSNVCMTRFDDIRLLRINYLRGPNLWTYRPVLEVWLDLGQLEDYPSNKIDGFTDRITALLPALIEHHCGVGERGARHLLVAGPEDHAVCLLYTSPSPRDQRGSRMPSSA